MAYREGRVFCIEKAWRIKIVIVEKQKGGTGAGQATDQKKKGLSRMDLTP